MCLCPCEYSTCGDQKRASDPLQLEAQAIVELQSAGLKNTQMEPASSPLGLPREHSAPILSSGP